MKKTKFLGLLAVILLAGAFALGLTLASCSSSSTDDDAGEPLVFTQLLHGQLLEVTISRRAIPLAVITPQAGDYYVIKLGNRIISTGTITSVSSSGRIVFTPFPNSAGVQAQFEGTINSGGVLNSDGSLPNGTKLEMSLPTENGNYTVSPQLGGVDGGDDPGSSSSSSGSSGAGGGFSPGGSYKPGGSATAPTITTTTLTAGAVGTAYNQTLTAAGTTPITWSIESGSLPTGLSLAASTGIISGIPTAGGTSFTVKATNSAGSAAKALSIAIKQAGGVVGAPTLNTKDAESITITAPSMPTSGQDVEYAISKTNTAPTSGWQDGLTFSGLDDDTTYYIFARSKENAAYNTGAASGSLTVTTDAVEIHYIITGTAPSLFSAAKDGNPVGTTGAIQAVIDAIKTDANKVNCVIKFGDTGELNIGTAGIDFDNTGGAWGTVILQGQITSGITTPTTGTIHIKGGAKVHSHADIKNTVAGRAIYNENASTGELIISAGTVSAIGTTGIAVYNASTGKITVS